MKQDIIRMFDAEVPVREISDAIGIPVPSVLAVLLRAGRGVEAKVSEDALEKEVVRRYSEYEPVSRTLRELRISARDYWKHIARSGVPVRPPLDSRLAKARLEEEVLAMYARGDVVTAIISQCGISRPRVYRILRRHGKGPDRT